MNESQFIGFICEKYFKTEKKNAGSPYQCWRGVRFFFFLGAMTTWHHSRLYLSPDSVRHLKVLDDAVAFVEQL